MLDNSITKVSSIEWEWFKYSNTIHDFGFQRSVDQNHVQEIVSFQKKHYLSKKSYFYPQSIVIGLFDSKYYIIDGQHRLKSLEYLKHPYNINISLLKIDSEEYLKQCLTIINLNKSYIQCETPVIKKIEQFFLDNFSIYCKTSNSPRIPHVNINTVITLLNRHAPTLNFDIFIETFNKLSLHIKNNYYSMNISNHNYQKCKNKNNSNPLYTGLMKNNNWVFAILQSIQSKTPIHSLNYDIFPYTRKRQTIPKQLRISLWAKYHTSSMVGTCYTCKTTVNFTDFECGHLKSVFHGGTNNIDNLRCLCKTCNNDMGVLNIYDYKKTFK
jgi:hypothetical protein